MLTLRLENISLGYREINVLTDVNLEVRPGEILGIIGPNGSGKSTLIKGMSRIITPNSGQIFIDGSKINELKHKDLAKLIAIVPQNATLPPLFTAIELVMLGRTPHLGLLRYESEEDLIIVKRAMDATNTIHLAQRRIGELSGGEKQRLVVARALAQEPKIMLLDEPTSNLDIKYQIETLDLVYQLCREQKLIVVAALHDLNLAAQYCDRLVILSEGRVYKLGVPEEIVNSETIKEVYGADVHVYPHPVNKLPTTLIISDKDHK
jgi:iron complex transport system ATP-binding protein